MLPTSQMNFSNIKVIGFDLDQTLYPKSPLIDKAIQQYIYAKIAEHRNISLAEAQKLFTDLYQDGKGLSGRKTLIELDIPNAESIVQEALENADIAEFLIPDLEVIDILRRLKDRYDNLDLITGSVEKIMQNKLAKLTIPFNLFDHIISGEIAKSDGSAYREWLKYYPNLKPEQFLYIGDREKTDYWVPKELGIQCLLVNIAAINADLQCLQLPTLLDLRKYLLA